MTHICGDAVHECVTCVAAEARADERARIAAWLEERAKDFPAEARSHWTPGFVLTMAAGAVAKGAAR